MHGEELEKELNEDARMEGEADDHDLLDMIPLDTSEVSEHCIHEWKLRDYVGQS